MTDWQVQDQFLALHSRWLTLIGEHLLDDQGQVLEYWRIEKADSVIVLPIQEHHLLLPAPSYRPGLGQATLDFPGGRLGPGQTAEQAAIAILHRELAIDATAISQINPLNRTGWAINSSFSNQRVFGFIAHLASSPDCPVTRYPATGTGLQALLPHLICLQCRAVLLEWWLHNSVTPLDL